MIFPAAVLLAQVAVAPSPAAPEAAAPSMIVTAQQLSAAVVTCRDQIGRTVFGGEELAAAGWPKVMSQGPDEAGYVMATYRHPTTMLMIALIHDPAKSDECTVMAPTGPEISSQSTTAEVGALLGRPRRGQWTIPSADVRQEAMGGGVRVIFTKKGSK